MGRSQATEVPPAEAGTNIPAQAPQTTAAPQRSEPGPAPDRQERGDEALVDRLRLEILQRAPLSHQPTLDGAWWPRSRSLADELPALVVELHKRGSRVSRVLFNPGTWDSFEQRKLAADGRVIRVGWFRTMDPHVLTLTSAAGMDRLDLLIVPPATAPDVAARAIADALAASNHLSASAVLQEAGSLSGS